MANSGYFVGDKATGKTLEQDFTDKGIGGGGSATQVSSNSVVQNQEIVVTHPADVTGTRIVQVTKFTAGGGASNTDLDFDLADAGQFIQEDAVNGTEFVGGKVVVKSDGSVDSSDTIDSGYGGILSNNDRTIYQAGNVVQGFSVDAVTSGKLYFEIYADTAASTMLGICNADREVAKRAMMWSGSGAIFNQSVGGYGAAYGAGTTIGCAVDVDAGTCIFSVNGTPYTAYDFGAYWGTWTGVRACMGRGSSSGSDTVTLVTADADFVYTPPVGYDQRLKSTVFTYPVANNYITTSDTNQINLENVASLDTTTITVEEPANTTIKGLVSFDGRTTWKKFGGYTWTDAGVTNLATYDWSNENADVTFLLQSDTVNGSTDFTESSAYSAVPTITGTPTHSTTKAKIGTTSLEFNGSTDYITYTHNDGYNFGTDDFTIDFWCNPSVSSGQKPIISHRDNSASGWVIEFYLTANVLDFHSGAAVILGQSGVPALPVNTWSHVAFVRESGVLYLYIDGVHIKNAPCTNNFELDYPLYVAEDVADVNNGLFSGHLDEIRITKGRAVWTSNFTPPITHYSITQNSSSVTQIETGLSSLTITDETSLDFAFDLGTTDTSVTPSIDQITLNYTEGGTYKQTSPDTFYDAVYTTSTTTTIKKLSAGTDNIKINVLV